MRVLKFKVTTEEYKVFKHFEQLGEYDASEFNFAINDYYKIISDCKELMDNEPMRKLNNEFIETHKPLIDIWNKYNPKDKVVL